MLKLFQFVIFIIAFNKLFAFPPDVEKCRINDEDCLVRSSNTVLRKYYNGLSAATVEKFSGFDKNLLEIHFKVSEFHFKGFYSATGVVFGYSSHDNGIFTLNFYDFKAKLTIKLERYMRNDKEYFKTVGSDISSTVRTGDLDATTLSRALNWILNKSFDLILSCSMKSYVGDVWTEYYEKAINAVLSKVPIEDLFIVD
ncbi:unnamed protein product [Chironomus riparius]|uniref:Uncharacterized protein n=1 Tax=Chironomus riparius TaxID=315576 RepID=A0A9P0J8U7_9DIPT|nr:unnamed protein product [Chironomus riparius]